MKHAKLLHFIDRIFIKFIEKIHFVFNIEQNKNTALTSTKKIKENYINRV